MRFIPRTVMIGFVNALAILIFQAQLPHVFGEGWGVWAMVAAGIAIIYALPKLTTAVPAPLVAIVVCTGAALAFDLRLPDVGDEGELPSALPFFHLPDVPFSLADLLQACVAPEPRDRPSIDDVADHLRALPRRRRHRASTPHRALGA